MLTALLLLTAAAQGPAVADPDAAFCASARGNEAQLRPHLPQMNGPNERLDSFTPDCRVRLLVWERVLLADPDLPVDAWRTRRQANWSALVCEIQRFRDAVARGWLFTERIALPDGSRHEFTARCDQDPSPAA
jgi:hypothetical protein